MDDKRLFKRAQFECPLQIKALAVEGKQLMRNSFSLNLSEIGVGVYSFYF